MTDRRVRGGGYRGPHGWVFEIYGDNLALDFVNTVNDRPSDQPIERLVRYEDLLSWCSQARTVSEESIAALRSLAAEHPRAATLALARAVAAREAIWRVMEAIVEGAPIPEGALRALNDVLQKAFEGVHLVGAGRGCSVVWETEAPDLDAPLAAILRATVSLLSSPEDLERVRACASETCRWLFLDRSRNGSRRWCDMTICGNRAKARRHQDKRRSG